MLPLWIEDRSDNLRLADRATLPGRSGQHRTSSAGLQDTATGCMGRLDSGEVINFTRRLHAPLRDTTNALSNMIRPVARVVQYVRCWEFQCPGSGIKRGAYFPDTSIVFPWTGATCT